MTDEDLNTLFSEGESPLQPITGEKLSRIKHYFSIREFSMLDKVLIFPVNYRNRPIAFLLITNSPLFEHSEAEISQLFRKLHDPIRYLIVASRREKLEKLHYNLGSSANVSEELSAMVDQASAAQKYLILIFISLDSVIEHIMHTAHDADPYRVRQDVIRILASMIPDNGKTLPLNEKYQIVALPKKTLLNPKLLIHQITLAMKGFFHLDNSLPEINYSVRVFPDDGDNANDLLNGFV